jgi:Raf kinase inhibitor-like YbhB/YbcL family protein
MRGIPLVIAAWLAAVGAGAPARLAVTSTDVRPGAPVPRQFTCDGDDVSPALQWSDLPDATRALVIVVDDPDAPGGTFTHWLALTGRVYRAGVARDEHGMTQGRNDFGSRRYRGPCPPKGKGVHHYRFQVFALDTVLRHATATGTRAGYDRAMKGHVLASGQLVATYGR